MHLRSNRRTDHGRAVPVPDIVLNESKWEIGKVGSDEAEIVLQYKKSEKPAVLKLFKEDNAWKLGLDESFGARGLSPF